MMKTKRAGQRRNASPRLNGSDDNAHAEQCGPVSHSASRGFVGGSHPRNYVKRQTRPLKLQGVMSVMLTVGDRIRKLRKDRNLTQVDAAVAIGTSRTNLTKIEKGEYQPGREVLMSAAAYFDVSLDWLANGHGAPEKGSARASTKEEALLLYAFRELPAGEAEPLLQFLVTRVSKRND